MSPSSTLPEFFHLSPTRRTVLLIDDSPDNLLILGDIMIDSGYEVMFAENGLSGIERTLFVKPDLIIMDVRMPGMNGLEACQALKQQDDFQEIPIILMSAQRGGNLRQEALNAGSTDFWEKPLTPDFLRTALKAILPTPQ